MVEKFYIKKDKTRLQHTKDGLLPQEGNIQKHIAHLSRICSYTERTILYGTYTFLQIDQEAVNENKTL